MEGGCKTKCVLLFVPIASLGEGFFICWIMLHQLNFFRSVIKKKKKKKNENKKNKDIFM